MRICSLRKQRKEYETDPTAMGRIVLGVNMLTHEIYHLHIIVISSQKGWSSNLSKVKQDWINQCYDRVNIYCHKSLKRLQ